MPRLSSISFSTSPRLPGMHGSPLSFDVPVRSGPLTGWKLSVRAEVILLRSPPGWAPGQNPRRPDTAEGNDVTVYEVPRDWAALQWTWAPGETLGEVVDWDEDAPVVVAGGIATSPGQQGGHMTPLDPISQMIRDTIPPGPASVAEALGGEPTKRMPGRPKKEAVT